MRPTSILKKIMNWPMTLRRFADADTDISPPSEVIESMPSKPTLWELDAAPTEEELQRVICKLKKGKAGGITGILPELIAYGGQELWNRMLRLMQSVWEEGKVFEDWKNADIVPIPKKGNLMVSDNW